MLPLLQRYSNVHSLLNLFTADSLTRAICIIALDKLPDANLALKTKKNLDRRLDVFAACLSFWSHYLLKEDNFFERRVFVS